MGQRVGQTKFELEINHWDSDVTQDLFLQNVSLAYQSGKVQEVLTEDFFIFLVTVTYNNILGVHSRFFTPDTPIISLFGIIQ